MRLDPGEQPGDHKTITVPMGRNIQIGAVGGMGLIFFTQGYALGLHLFGKPRLVGWPVTENRIEQFVMLEQLIGAQREGQFLAHLAQHSVVGRGIGGEQDSPTPDDVEQLRLVLVEAAQQIGGA